MRKKAQKKAKSAPRGSYAFVDKQKSLKGMISTILALIALVGLIILLLVSYIHKGQGGLWLGFAGLLFLIMIVVGFILAIISFRDKEIEYGFPISGLVGNGILLLVYFIIYVVGIVV